MTYAAHRNDFASCFNAKAPTKREPVARKSGVLRRIVDAVFESRQRQADRQIAGFIARSGGRLTDDLERRLMQRLTTSNWSARD